MAAIRMGTIITRTAMAAMAAMALTVLTALMAAALCSDTGRTAAGTSVIFADGQRPDAGVTALTPPGQGRFLNGARPPNLWPAKRRAKDFYRQSQIIHCAHAGDHILPVNAST